MAHHPQNDLPMSSVKTLPNQAPEPMALVVRAPAEREPRQLWAWLIFNRNDSIEEGFSNGFHG